MPRKSKFKLEIRRVKLNPEQAVLTCDCYDHGWRVSGDSMTFPADYVCSGKTSEWSISPEFTQIASS